MKYSENQCVSNSQKLNSAYGYCGQATVDNLCLSLLGIANATNVSLFIYRNNQLHVI